MSYFPFFIDIQDKDGLIVGGGQIAAHKIEKLKPFGTRLTVVAPGLPVLRLPALTAVSMGGNALPGLIASKQIHK